MTDADGNTGYAATAEAATIILGVRGGDAIEGEDIDAEEDAASAREECRRGAAKENGQ